MSKYCLFLIVIYYLTGGNNSMSRFCKFGKLHVTKGNVDKLSERQRVHLSEWKEDLMAYISEKSDVYKPYLVTTKKEIREALGIPERTLDKLLKVLKANQEIFFKIKPGRNGGIQLASVKSLLLSIIKVKKEEKESYIKALSEFFDLEHTFIQETLNKLAERPKTDTQLDLFSYDTG